MSSDSVACLQVECKQMELAVGTLAAGCHLGIDYRRMKITVKSLPALLLGCTSTPRWLLERCCSTTSLQEGNGEVSPAHQAKVPLCVGLSDCQESDALTGAGVPCHCWCLSPLSLTLPLFESSLVLTSTCTLLLTHQKIWAKVRTGSCASTHWHVRRENPNLVWPDAALHEWHSPKK